MIHLSVWKESPSKVMTSMLEKLIGAHRAGKGYDLYRGSVPAAMTSHHSRRKNMP